MQERLDDEHDELGDVLFQVYFLTPPARRGAGRRPRQRRGRDRGQAHPPPRPHLRRRRGRDGGRRARRVGARQARRRGSRGRVPQRAEHAAGPAAGAQGAAARRRGRVRLGARPRGVSQDRRGARRARRPVRGPAVGVRTRAQAGLAELERRLRHEFGDLLFATVNVARKLGVDPEIALREACDRFVRRVDSAAELAARDGRSGRSSTSPPRTTTTAAPSRAKAASTAIQEDTP